MSRAMYGYPYSYSTPMPHSPYYRGEFVQSTESTVLPKTIMYFTKVEPKLIEHLMMQKGQKVCIITSVGKLEGTLDDVYIDHVALVSLGKTKHVRLSEIVYFEKA
ncbi:MAG: hypothetical protein K0S39_907 [Paenibacillus sp.]|jgi:hypothetical protein|nr:hypothetical protein [Paenibacillus sp.]